MDISRLDELFECLLCCEHLGDRSKVLPCQHTFCRECLESWYVAKGHLQCPECRTDYMGTTVDSLSPNVFLERLLNGISKKDETNSNSEEKESKTGQSRRPRTTLWKWKGIGNNKKQPCAKALYSFQGTEDGDLSFSKGDIIMLSDILDENWYEGVLSGKTGVFPVNFVQVLVPFPSLDAVSKQEPLARAVYDFDHGKEDHLLVFSKGNIISVVKKIDENWCEGLLGDQHGIFPFNHVELNAAAEVLCTSNESSDEEDECSDGSKENSKISSSNRLKKIDSPKRHTIHVDNPDEQGITQSQQVLQHSDISARNRGRRASETSLQDSIHQFSTMRASLSSNGVHERLIPRSSSHDRFLRASTNTGASARENRPEPAPSSRNGSVDPKPSLFVCIYSYTGQKADELPLIRGEIYIVIERYRDGWCKGYRARSRSKRTGMFPGTYLKPASQHHIQLSRSFYSQSHQAYQLYMQQQQQQHRLAVPAIQHSHSSSAPVIMGHQIHRHCQVNEPVRQQHPPTERARSGSEPIDPSTVARDKSRSGLASFIRKLKKKKAIPAPVPPPYSSLPCASLRVERPIPLLPAEPPPPYSPPSSRRMQPPRSPTTDVPQSFLYNYDRYRALVEFPPQSELELELKPGDVVFVIKRREDGWYHGKSQRTGKVGLFPASFVGRY